MAGGYRRLVGHTRFSDVLRRALDCAINCYKYFAKEQEEFMMVNQSHIRPIP